MKAFNQKLIMNQAHKQSKKGMERKEKVMEGKKFDRIQKEEG
jgi:hypothetical protein